MVFTRFSRRDFVVRFANVPTVSVLGVGGGGFVKSVGGGILGSNIGGSDVDELCIVLKVQ